MADPPVMDKRTTDLGTARLGPLMVKLSIPGMIGMLVMSVYNIIDTFWVSGLPTGTEAIAALTVLFPIQMISGAAGMGIAAGLTSLVARRFGAARLEEANCAVGNAISLAVIVGSTFSVAGVAAAEPVVRLFGATPEITAPSIAYLKTVAAGFPFLMLGMALTGAFRGAGDAVTPMLLTGLGAGINAGLDPFLIYGLGPFPRLEIQGAAVATVAAQLAVAIASVAYLRRRRSGYDVRLHDLRLQPAIIGDIAQVGAPAAAMNCLRSVVASVYNWVLGGFGPAAIAAHGLGHRVMMLVISCLGGGVHQALMPIVGYTFGAKDYRRMWSAYRIAALWTSGGGLVLGGLVCLFAKQILAPVARDPELLRLGVLSLRLKMCTFFLVEPQMMAVFSLQGMGMGGRAMLLTMSRNIIFVLPGLFLLSSYFGVTGAFAAQPVADVLGLFVAGTVLWRVYRKYPPSATACGDTDETEARAAGGCG
jgi:putative MATE family efflux protein